MIIYYVHKIIQSFAPFLQLFYVAFAPFFQFIQKHFFKCLLYKKTELRQPPTHRHKIPYFSIS